MRRSQATSARVARFKGFHDGEGRFVSFAASDEILRRAHAQGARVLLRLDGAVGSELRGRFHSRPAR